MNDLKDILTNWNTVTLELETAISKRQNRDFVLLYRKGCKCFDQLREIIDSNDKESLLHFQAEIKTTINQWKHITELLKPWLAEVQAELSTTKEKQVKQKKVGKLFNAASKKSGINLKVKAK